MAAGCLCELQLLALPQPEKFNSGYKHEWRRLLTHRQKMPAGMKLYSLLKYWYEIVYLLNK